MSKKLLKPKIWMDQCEAAENIREQYGHEKAIGYLIGEKFSSYLEFIPEDEEATKELPAFISEIRRLFTTSEIENCLKNLWTLESWGHASDKETYKFMKEQGAVLSSPADSAKDILVVERMKKLLLD